MSRERTRGKRRWWGARRWHRYLGAVFALPLLWLCVTGLLLQHRETLGLDEREVRSEWLLNRYDQMPEGDPRGTSAGRFAVAGWDGVLFVDGKVLDEGGNLVGAVATPAELVVATAEEVFVYDAQGIYLDRLGEESLPGLPLERIGIDESHRVHLEVAGESYVLGDGFLDHERAEDGVVVNWSALTEDGARRSLLRDAVIAEAGFTWSRVVTDLHSGSLLGRVGRFLVDLTGIAVIVVTLFGIRLLFKRTPKSNQA